MDNVHRIEVGIASSEGLKNAIIQDLGITTIKKVEIINVYTLEGGNLTSQELDFLGKEVFSDPIVEKFAIDTPLASAFPGVIIEVGFKPGVTDNVGHTSVQAVKDAIKKDLKAAYASKQYLLYGVDAPTGEKIARDLLANQLIERWQTLDGKTYKGFTPYIPVVKLGKDITVEEVNLELPDNELVELSKNRLLALTLEEMIAIRDYYRKVAPERKKKGLPTCPTDIELECIAQTWSEHCKHKIFNAKIEYEEPGKKETIDSLFKTYIRDATKKINSPYLVSVFKDNAGVIKFNEEYTFAMKVETHNSPTALDPYGGALTGIVGCNRDPAGTGQGFKLIFNTDVFCFASPFYNGDVPPRLFHPRRVLKGVHKGIIDGGNQSGIPTVNGSLYFDPRFLGKPLVFCGTGGIAPAKINNRPSHEKGAKLGDLVVMVGGRIGADGIHGATFSSLEINENSPATAVQIGAPIVQKNMLDFLLEARDLGLFNSITDDGAGGLSSSVGEMGEDLGARVDLEKAPLKYPGLMPWEILLSEAQERMTVAVSKDKIKQFETLAKKYEVESTVLGEFDGSKHFEFYYNGKCIGSLAMEFLHQGVPQKQMRGVWKPKTGTDPVIPAPTNYADLFKTMLGRLNICSKEDAIVRRYDHEVQAGSIIKPFMGAMRDGPSDAGVVKPLFKSWEGLAISHGICPRYSDIDTYWMVANAVDEAVRNAVCSGADPDYMAGLDNFCWAMGFGDEDERQYTGALVRANKALYDITTAYKVPCISGKDSMKNDYRIGNTKVSVPPTMMYSLVGKLPDVRKAVSMDVKNPGDFIYILGLTKAEIGATEYLDQLGHTGVSVPKVDFGSAISRYRKLFQAIQKGLVASAHDCSDGGLGIALAESAFAGNLGMEIELQDVPQEGVNREDILLFSESASRIIVTVKPEKAAEFEKTMKGTIFAKIGQVKGDSLILHALNGSELMKIPVTELKQAWQKTLRFLAGGE
jgi:phosphoribosylformylglycinamidine synthase